MQEGREAGKVQEPKTILLVEDEAIIAMAQMMVLKRFGYAALSAGTGEKAVDLACGNEAISLVLMDIDLGLGIDGTEAARRILTNRNIPIVFLTSHSEREMVEKVRGITRYGYVIKNSGDFVLQSSIEMAFELFDAHERTKGQEAELEAIYENTPVIMALLDEDRRVYKANHSAARFTGIPVKNMIGLRIGEALGCLNAMEVPEGCGFGKNCSVCTLRNTVLDKFEAGTGQENVAVSLPFMVDGARVNYQFILSTKILRIFGRPLALVSLMDVSELAYLNRKLRMLSDSNQALIRFSDESALLNEVCRIIVGVGGYRTVWVGFAEQDADKTLRPVAKAGDEAVFIDGLRMTWADTEKGQSPGGIAIRTGKPYLVRDIPGESTFAPWRENAVRHGYNSVLVLPLIGEGNTIGVIGIHSAEVDAFDAGEIAILMELSGDLSFGITALRTRAKRDQAEAALKVQYSMLRGIIDGPDALIFSVDRHYRYTSFNKGHEAVMRAIYGARIEIGHDLFEYMTVPADQVKARGNIDRALKGERLLEEAPSGEDRLSRRYFQVSHGPIRAESGEIIGVAVFAQDITERRRAEDQVRYLARVYATLSQVNQAIVREFRRDALFDKICGIALEFGEFHSAWIGELGTTGMRVEVVSRAGPMHGSVLSEDKIADIRSGKTIITEEAGDGFRSFAAIPIKLRGEAIWMFCLFATEAGFFDDEERRLLEEIGLDISFALDTMELENERTKAERELHKLNEELERRVQDRTAELERKNADLRRMNRLFVGRELQMIELKKRLKESGCQETENEETANGY
ncbi:MAG: hypothetical protein A2413_07635 [Treponema sp. RIFOXYC1_FULL_61_9]|nr:MAG: hypothetical protein A2001_14790 [Treponema sp. GWC1_61_84]OHE68876.1 MAG: hypothetical protein A2413_07635 [Treponema sp. RIFOXYC1_FULL_61_9]